MLIPKPGGGDRTGTQRAQRVLAAEHNGYTTGTPRSSGELALAAAPRTIRGARPRCGSAHELAPPRAAGTQRVFLANQALSREGLDLCMILTRVLSLFHVLFIAFS